MTRSSGGQRALDTVERDHLLAGARRAHDDLGAVDLVEVEGVERLAALQQHEVRRVDHAGDGPDAAGLEPLREPGGRRPDPHPLDDPRRVAEAAVRSLDGNPQGRRCQRGLLLQPGLRVRHRDAGGCRDLAGDAEVRERVGTVGGDVDLEDHVLDAEHAGHRCARNRVAGKLQESRGLLGEPQFLGGAEHAVGVDAAKLGVVDAVAGRHPACPAWPAAPRRPPSSWWRRRPPAPARRRRRPGRSRACRLPDDARTRRCGPPPPRRAMHRPAPRPRPRAPRR